MNEPTQQDLLDLAKCPHCGVNSPLLERKFKTHFQGVVVKKTQDWSVYFCRSCGGLVAAGGPHGSGGKIDIIIPEPVKIAPEIPDRPREYLVQAVDTLHAPSASIMVSASAVDAMLKVRGFTKGTLNQRIDEAAAKRLITAEMAAWAHDVRLDANDERHADQAAPAPTGDDARRCLDFAVALAEYLFVLPAAVARGRSTIT